jgi:rhodanese-related sulfurtransferase
MSKIKSISPENTWEIIQKKPNAIFIDCRSSMEFLFVGHPVGAVNIAWIDEPDWDINPNFATEVRKLILGGIANNKNTAGVPIILICRSGVRSLDAGKCLIKAHFNNIYNVLGGFEGDLDDKHRRGNINGWRFHDLPWEQC